MEFEDSNDCLKEDCPSSIEEPIYQGMDAMVREHSAESAHQPGDGEKRGLNLQVSLQEWQERISSPHESPRLMEN